ncbi:thyroid hormone-induced protein B-like [Amphiura filiformis]|uniref:thyroid hormone-induced protein B-like n=1 Tax=Amphiura filiformis TaxID=82378 RepID=UPI003B223CCA
MAPGSGFTVIWRVLTLSILLVFLRAGAVNGQLDCNFDGDTCGWQQIQLDDQFDWTRRSGDTPTSDTGPYADHTTGTGSYIYAEASNRAKGQQARMISEDVRINVNSYKCFRFWYFIYGSSIGAFRIFTSPTGAFDDLGTPIYEIKTTQGNQWVMGQMDMKSYDGSAFKIVLESEIGNGESGDIAIDDVSVFSGLCPQVIVTPSPGTMPSVLQCDFEDQAICNFVQDVQDDLDWVRQSGRTGTPGTGPPVDHTYGTDAGRHADLM